MVLGFHSVALSLYLQKTLHCQIDDAGVDVVGVVGDFKAFMPLPVMGEARRSLSRRGIKASITLPLCDGA